MAFENIKKSCWNRGLRFGVRVIAKLSCQCIIDWLDDENNKNSETASEFIENLDSEYDICVVIDARTFIYDLLGKPLSELLAIGAGE